MKRNDLKNTYEILKRPILLFPIDFCKLQRPLITGTMTQAFLIAWPALFYHKGFCITVNEVGLLSPVAIETRKQYNINDVCIYQNAAFDFTSLFRQGK